MDLTKRDALVVLVGAGVLGSSVLERGFDRDDGSTIADSDLETLEAVADLLYPSAVDETRAFVETYVVGRQRWDDAYLDDVRGALDVLQSTSRRETGRAFAALDAATRDDVLRATGADRAHAAPDGTDAQRVRYYLVDELLYAFYASPVGGELAGNENPAGYPGGTDAYRQPPGGGRGDDG